MLPNNMNVKIEDVVNYDFSVEKIGTPTLDSPLKHGLFVEECEKISYCADVSENRKIFDSGKEIPAFVAAGPRRKIYFDPEWTRAAIVTCGGLCPGLNDVIKALVNTLTYIYGVKTIYGIKYGYSGLNPKYKLSPIELTPDVVDGIHNLGGSLLGSSRGNQPVEEMVKTIERLHINMLFTIGGDGTQRGAHAIAMECKKRNVACSVVGIPKTIDNDLNFMDKTFGFETAVETAGLTISCAHAEATGTDCGVGLVRLMGRDSGFIAAHTALANSMVNFCLIPEMPFELEGQHGLLEALKRRLDAKHHAVIVVAEGAGQNLISGDKAKDASGNELHKDIGQYLKDEITRYFKEQKHEISVKYIDPSYIIRSVPACGSDAIFCIHLAQNAVHAAMAGMTDLVVGHWNGYFTYVPISLATSARRKIDPLGQLWRSVLMTTCQIKYMYPELWGED